jgi:hypothetical protein
MPDAPSADWWFGFIFVTLVALGLAICAVWAIALMLAGLLKAITWPWRRRYAPAHRRHRRL